MIKVGVLGATGYAGIETVRILSNHPKAEVTLVASKSFAGKKISDVYPNLKNIIDLVCTDIDVLQIKEKCDVVFTALPHGASKEIIPSLINAGVKVIDLSGDYRYNDPEVYQKWYGQPHSSPELLEKSVYGLCEIYKDQIKNATLVGNPGCYTTCSIMALAPLLKNNIIEHKNIIIDAKSGVTGAGRSSALDFSYCEVSENMKAYKIATHRHTSEIEQELSLAANDEIMVSFTPHLIPLKRGILATCYANLSNKISPKEVLEVYKNFYKDKFFVRILEDTLPETKNVSGSNFIDIGFKIDTRLNRIIVVSALDNLIKGAAGQAIQNLNIMFSLNENTGLSFGGNYL